ncbi:1-acyl-sn-glycerol-3-phosphate acyltransferase [bacterium]|nr:1-acyl-sn-glycerol-3-phosphate acyltransferase [bacterium]
MIKRIAASIFFTICAPFLFFGSIFAYISFKIAGLFGKSVLLVVSRIVHLLWGRFAVYSALSSVRVVGKKKIPHGKAVVMYSNHASFFDIPIISGFVLPSGIYVARKGLALSPAIKASGGVLIEQKSTRKEIRNIREIVSKIKAGRSFIIFPEGTRSRDGSVGELKAGSLKIAQWAEVPAIPIRIEGSRDLLARGMMWPKPSKIVVYIGDPITCDEIRADSSAVLEKITDFYTRNTN